MNKEESTKFENFLISRVDIVLLGWGHFDDIVVHVLVLNFITNFYFTPGHTVYSLKNDDPKTYWFRIEEGTGC